MRAQGRIKPKRREGRGRPAEYRQSTGRAPKEITDSMKITAYALIREEDPQTFTSLVNAAVKDGWHPTGGVAMVREPGQAGHPAKVFHAQAMVMLRSGANGKEIVV